MDFRTLSAPSNPPPKPPSQVDLGIRSAKLKVTGRLKTAIEAMVWQGLKRDDAAAAAGLTINGLYSALRKPHVRQAYLAECEVLRVSGRARRIHRLEEIAEASSNLNASVQAIRTLDYEPLDGTGRSASAASAPGVTIHIHAAGPASQPIVDVTPPDATE